VHGIHAASTAASMSSFITISTAVSRKAALILRASAMRSAVDACLWRTCTTVAPPATAARAVSTIECCRQRSGSSTRYSERSNGFFMPA